MKLNVNIHILLETVYLRSTSCLFSADWKYRHAGLMALSAIGEGCHQQMEAILQEIVSFVLLFCSDPVSKMHRSQTVSEMQQLIYIRFTSSSFLNL